MDDHQLLQEFVSSRSAEAFRRMMERHLPMVYSAACRMVLDASLAQDVAQKVFLTFSQKAESIKPPQMVGGWLYNTTRNIAMHTVREEQRRREREQAAAIMQTLQADGVPDHIAAHLEPAMAELDSDDRDALVLRYFENRSLREVGSEFGISEDAARMRVNRAVDRLKEIFNRRGVAVSSVGLVSALGVSTTTTVPAALSGAIVTSVFGAAVTKTIAVATMNWINIKSIGALATAVILTGAGTYVVQQRQVEQLRRSQQSLTVENKNLQTQLTSAQDTARDVEEQLTAVRQNNGELLRLRNEVGQLRQQIAVAKAAETTARIQKMASTAVSRADYHFTRDRLAYGGYDSPEAALQTAAWAAILGGQDRILETLSPELLADKNAVAIYRRNQSAIAPILKGIRLISRKSLSETEVQIKVEYEVGMGNGAVQKMYAVTPMMKGAQGWKLGITKDYSDDWEKNGTVEALGGD